MNEPVRAAITLEEGSRGRRLGIGFSVPFGSGLEVGAAWSSSEPSLRFAAGVARDRLALGAGWAWHSTLPAIRVVALSYGAPASRTR
jgi:hypothetical protein